MEKRIAGQITRQDLGDIKLIFENQYKNIIDKLPAAQQLPAQGNDGGKTDCGKNQGIHAGNIFAQRIERKRAEASGINRYALVNTHIIRRDQGGTVEISHDTLVEPIFKSL